MQTWPVTPTSTFMHVDFGRDKSQPLLICHQNADSYKVLTPEQVYRLHENKKKRMYERRVPEIAQEFLTSLVFTTTGGMGRDYLRYHSRLAELISINKGEDYAQTLTWIRGKVSFSILRSALLYSEAPDQLGGGPIMLKTLM